MSASPLLRSVSFLIAFLGCASACAEIYKWVDAKGTTVYSNIPPAETKSVTNLEVMVEDAKISDSTSATTNRELELFERISRLERQLQAQSYPPALPYAAPPPPPPAYYPAAMYYPLYPVYRTYYPYAAVVPARFVVPARIHSFHRAGVHRGRP